MRARSKRMIAVSTAGALILGAAALVYVGLGRHADLFYTPQMLTERGMPEPGERIRLGGYVEQGTLTHGDGAEMTFVIVDGSTEQVLVSYTGIAPDLFREGEGVVATGRFDANQERFLAEEILAKHDENYQPKELLEVANPSAPSS